LPHLRHEGIELVDLPRKGGDRRGKSFEKGIAVVRCQSPPVL
jgi:hypothetical protein